MAITATKKADAPGYVVLVRRRAGERDGCIWHWKKCSAEVPSITIHSLTQEMWNARILHTSRDKISEMRLDEYYASYRLIAAYLAYLDQLLQASTGKTH